MKGIYERIQAAVPLTRFHPYIEFGTDERMAEVLRDELVRPQALEHQGLKLTTSVAEFGLST